MIGTWSDFVGNVLSNIVSAAVCLTVPLLLVFGLYYRPGRRRLRRFFGITDRRHSTIQVRLSNIYVKPAGSLSPLSIGHGFIGPAINATEYEYALELAEAVKSRPFAGQAYALLEQFGVEAMNRPVACEISPSIDYVDVPHHRIDEHKPVDFDNDQKLVGEIGRTLSAHRTLVLVGSPVYNVLTHFVLSNCGDQTRIQFVESKSEPGHAASGVEVFGFHHTGASESLQRRETQVGDTTMYEEYFALQKITNWNGGRTTIFVCAGTSTAATAAALTRLAKWGELADTFGMGPFTVVYSVRTIDREMPGTTEERHAPWHVSRVWPPER
ncbi:MAG TPA: hypothetical protein VFE14_03525 [Micromonosporaceae bacterium]|nr:hypothetical protein [Micromonosporaceae bacterium]